MALRCPELRLGTGDPIFQEGSAGVWAYLLLEGGVRVLRKATSGREVTLGKIGAGELLGEYALLPPYRNTATCRATCPTRLLQLPLLPLRPVYAAKPGVGPNLKNWLRLHALRSHLLGQSFLGFMSGPSALALLDFLRPATFQPHQTIQADGLAPDLWFFVEAGRVELHPPGNRAHELGPGDSFGERALQGLGDLPVAVARTEVRCLALPRSAFAPPGQDGSPPSLQSFLALAPLDHASYPWVGQQEAADCGAAALAMAARRLGLDVSLEQARRLLPVGPRGASLADLEKAALALALRCLVVQVSAEQLPQLDTPFIAHMRDGHYVAVFEVRHGVVVLGDPASGVVRLSHPAFAQACSGRLLLTRPSAP